jgi:hypothetical protein
MLWEACDELEEALQSGEISGRRVKVASAVYLRLLEREGSNRAEMVRDAVKYGGYSEEYAKKIVDKTLRRLEELYGRIPTLHIERRGSGKGRWWKPKSRHGERGRPPIRRKLERRDAIKMDERMVKLVCLTTLLSGSFERFMKLVSRVMRDLRLMGDLQRILKDVLGIDIQIPDNPNEALSSFDVAIDDVVSKVMEPIWREIPAILGINRKRKAEANLRC